MPSPVMLPAGLLPGLLHGGEGASEVGDDSH